MLLTLLTHPQDCGQLLNIWAIQQFSCSLVWCSWCRSIRKKTLRGHLRSLARCETCCFQLLWPETSQHIAEWIGATSALACFLRAVLCSALQGADTAAGGDCRGRRRSCKPRTKNGTFKCLLEEVPLRVCYVFLLRFSVSAPILQIKYERSILFLPDHLWFFFFQPHKKNSWHLPYKEHCRNKSLVTLVSNFTYVTQVLPN